MVTSKDKNTNFCGERKIFVFNRIKRICIIKNLEALLSRVQTWNTRYASACSLQTFAATHDVYRETTNATTCRERPDAVGEMNFRRVRRHESPRNKYDLSFARSSHVDLT